MVVQMSGVRLQMLRGAVDGAVATFAAKDRGTANASNSTAISTADGQAIYIWFDCAFRFTSQHLQPMSLDQPQKAEVPL